MVLKNLFTGQQWKNRHKNRLMAMGRGEEKVRCMEKCNMETYITICKIDSQQEFAAWLRKLKQGLCTNKIIKDIVSYAFLSLFFINSFNHKSSSLK